jgi:tRNA threonylcarbamoyladenosine biosynthesis protein TsaB
MGLLLNIDTAFETACVSISRSAEIVISEKSHTQKDHASFLQPAIERACATAGIHLSDIDAVAVANGPGSYTGLRVGLASAKALCYALHKPLILLNTLDILASALKDQPPHAEPNILYCPMIDARRMEVYTALYDLHLNFIQEPAAVILSRHFLEEEREIYYIIVGGNGSNKLNR